MKEKRTTTLYKRNAGFNAKLNISSRNKIRDKMKISSSKTRTTLILDRYRQAKRTKPQTKNKMMKERNINFSKKGK